MIYMHNKPLRLEENQKPDMDVVDEELKETQRDLVLGTRPSVRKYKQHL